MNCTTTEEDGVLVVSLEGRLVAACADEVREAILAQMERAPNVLLDLSGMVHIDSTGLGMLVQLLQRATALGGTVKIACLQAHPRIVFDITKAYRVFEIHDTVESARAAFARAPGA